MRALLKGGAAGAMATVPMTAFMARAFRELPRRERYPLAPRLITERLLEKAEVEDEVPEDAVTSLTYASHFAYGAAVGAGLGLLSSRLRMSPARGAAYGLAVWTGSYLGWLPALGILTPATEHPPKRTALMIAAHLVYGAALGAILTPKAPDR